MEGDRERPDSRDDRDDWQQGVAVTSTWLGEDVHRPGVSASSAPWACWRRAQQQIRWRTRAAECEHRQTRLWARCCGRKMAFEREFVSADWAGWMAGAIRRPAGAAFVAGFGDQRGASVGRGRFHAGADDRDSKANAGGLPVRAKDIGTVEGGASRFWSSFVETRHAHTMCGTSSCIQDGAARPAVLIAAASGRGAPIRSRHRVFSPLGLNFGHARPYVLLGAVIG